MAKLFLDDRRTPPRGDGYIAADNYADFLALLAYARANFPDAIITGRANEY